MHVLLTVLHTFLMVLVGRICLHIRTPHLNSHDLYVRLSNHIRCLSLLGLKVLLMTLLTCRSRIMCYVTSSDLVTA